MNGNDIKKHLELYLSTSVDEEKLILIINESLELIGDMAFCYEEIKLSPDGEGWASLPETTTAIISVEINDRPYDNWTSRGMRVHFADVGVYDVVIRKMIPKIESLEDEIKAHPLFKPSILAYVRGTFKVIDDDNSQDGQRLVSQFFDEVLKAHDVLKRIRERNV